MVAHLKFSFRERLLALLLRCPLESSNPTSELLDSIPGFGSCARLPAPADLGGRDGWQWLGSCHPHGRPARSCHPQASAPASLWAVPGISGGVIWSCPSPLSTCASPRDFTRLKLGYAKFASLWTSNKHFKVTGKTSHSKEPKM